MAKVKLKKNQLTIDKKILAANSKAARQIKSEIVTEIIAGYEKGISPVKGYNRFKRYADSTAKRKGRKTPVNLRESGELHNSLTARLKKSNAIELFFKGARNSKLARWITFGTKNMDARPLLPAGALKFKKGVIDKIKAIVIKNIKEKIK